MTKRDEPLAAVPDPAVRTLLARLHAEADREMPKLVWRFAGQGPKLLFGRRLPWERLRSRLDDAFIALDRTQGAFCYLLARALGAKRIVEFGEWLWEDVLKAVPHRHFVFSIPKFLR